MKKYEIKLKVTQEELDIWNVIECLFMDHFIKLGMRETFYYRDILDKINKNNNTNFKIGQHCYDIKPFSYKLSLTKKQYLKYFTKKLKGEI